MIKPALFSQAFAKIKNHLPDLEIRDKVQKILQECDIVTEAELEIQLQQIEKMRIQMAVLESRIAELEKARG